MLFSYKSYHELLSIILGSGYSIYGIEEILASRANNKRPIGKYVAIRHDVDYFPSRAAVIASIEAEQKISTTYYIRRRFFESDIELVRKIASLGHQIGYHYEEVDTHQKAPNLQVERDAAGFFIGALLDINRLGFAIKSVCPHGNPLTDVDNRQVVHLLRDDDYLDNLAFNYDRETIKREITDHLVGDASIDIGGDDFDLYIPDTGRFNPKYNLKDRIDNCPITGLSNLNDLKLILNDSSNSRIYMNMHPDRWSGDMATWLFDFTFDTIKNVLKKLLGKTEYRGKIIGNRAKKHHRSVMKSVGKKTDGGSRTDS